MRKLGIIGGGQLARMMIPPCLNLNLCPTVLDEANAVASSFSPIFVEGSFRDNQIIEKTFSDYTHVTIDIESIGLEGYKALEAKGVLCSPSSRVLEIIANKYHQKNFFRDHKISTGDFKWLEKVDQETPAGFLKVPTGGYDGKGVFNFLEPKEKYHQLPDEYKKNVLWEAPVSIEREASVIVVRNRLGECIVYDPTEMVFDHKLNLIQYTLFPGRFTPSISERMKSLAIELAQKLEMVGALAVEMFLTKEGEVLINELAPRPHNSGHHTIESCYHSQFENHMRAVCDLPLGSAEKRCAALTFNIVATGRGWAQWKGVDELLGRGEVYLHNYGKNQAREGRKMGHVTLLGQKRDDLIEKYHFLSPLLKVIGVEHES